MNWRLWRQNLCVWRHQQIFITWFKFDCRSGQTIKVPFNFNFIRTWTKKPIVLRGAFGSYRIIWDWYYDLAFLQQCGKRVKYKTQKVLKANSYSWRSYRGNTGWGKGLFVSHILNKFNSGVFNLWLLLNNKLFYNLRQNLLRKIQKSSMILRRRKGGFTQMLNHVKFCFCLNCLICQN